MTYLKKVKQLTHSLILAISHYTVINTMFMYFCVCSLGREDGCRRDRNT